MSTAKKAKKGNTVLILVGRFEGQKAKALGEGSEFLAKVVDGKDKGKIINVLDGHYMVVGG